MAPAVTKRLPPVRANVGIGREYYLAIMKLVRPMAEEYEARLRALYRRDPPAMAQDEALAKKIVAAEQRPGVWHALVNGEPLRHKDGVAREFKTQAAAETAALKVTGYVAVVGQPVRQGDPFTPFEDIPIRETPAQSLEELLDGMGAKWEERFATAAPKIARHFQQTVEKQSEQRLRGILRDSGVTVKMQLTPELEDVARASVAENVSLIKSVASRYQTQVRTLVMQSVREGRDLSTLSRELENRFGITRRQAEGIALDQNNKVTTDIQRAKQTGAGIETGIWRHSHAGKVPRPTHVENDGKPFDLRKGWYDPAERKRIWPGQLIRCRCFWTPVVKGFS